MTKLPTSGLGLKIPPIRIVAGPVWANLTGTIEPTWSSSLLAVVVSISNSPAASAGEPLPSVTCSVTVCERLAGVAATRR